MCDEKRIALIGVIVENQDAVEEMNHLLHDYREHIIGRMGIPHPEKKLSIISLAVESDQDTISALSGKLGALDGVSTEDGVLEKIALEKNRDFLCRQFWEILKFVGIITRKILTKRHNNGITNLEKPETRWTEAPWKGR